MAKCKVTGRVITNVKLSCDEIQSPPASGQWSDGPKDSIPVNTAGFDAFIGESGNGGLEGWVKYLAEDGTLFKMFFKDPYVREDNYCTISAQGGSPALYSYSVQVPKTGHEVVAVFTIVKHDS